MASQSEKNILLVEDNSGIRLALTFALEDEGYKVHPVANGQEALKFLSAQSCAIGLIFLDTMMPIMDGFAFRAEQIKSDVLLAIPTILYSADPVNRLKAEAIGLPFIRKPFELKEVFEMIAKYFP